MKNHNLTHQLKPVTTVALLAVVMITSLTSVGCAKLQEPVATYSPEEITALEQAKIDQLQVQDEVLFEIEMENDFKQFELETSETSISNQ